MKSKLSTFFMISGIVLIFGALSLFVWNQYEAEKAKNASAEIRSEIDNSMGDNIPNPYNQEMTVVEIDGYGYIGYLDIPKLNISLPVMSEWDYTRMKIAPCRYYGSTKTNNLVIAAHNYSSHFGRLLRLKVGDEIAFTDMDKVTTRYEVAAVDILAKTAVEEMVNDEYDLTLFTCTYGGENRVTVRCERVV